VAVSTNNWVTSDSGSNGLWKQCDKDGSTNCEKIPNDQCVAGNSFSQSSSSKKTACNTTRAFSILNIIFSFFSLIAQWISKAFAKTKIALASLAALFGVIAMSVYTDNSKVLDSTPAKYGWSFGLLIFNWVVKLIVAAYSYVTKSFFS